MGSMLEWLKIIVIMQLFFSASITMISHAMPEDAIQYSTIFNDYSSSHGIEEIGGQVDSTLSRQTKVPIIELGSLIFYSGNILVDFLLNFAAAIPEMIGLLVNGITLLFALNTDAFIVAEGFAAVAIASIYIIGLVQTLLNLRGQGNIT